MPCILSVLPLMSTWVVSTIGPCAKWSMKGECMDTCYKNILLFNPFRLVATGRTIGLPDISVCSYLRNFHALNNTQGFQFGHILANIFFCFKYYLHGCEVMWLSLALLNGQ